MSTASPALRRRRQFKRLLAIIGVVAAIAGAIAKFGDFVPWAQQRWAQLGCESLGGVYPGECWKTASPDDYAWLLDEWCYPSLPGFVSRFALQNGQLHRQNEGGPAQYIKTDWIAVSAYRSNRDVLRLVYPKSQDWPSDFVQFSPQHSAEWHEYNRYQADDGSVLSGDKRLVLSCKRCRVDKAGISYNCR